MGLSLRVRRHRRYVVAVVIVVVGIVVVLQDIVLSSLRIVNVTSANGRVMRLRAEDPEEARMWIKTLLARRKRMNRRSGSVRYYCLLYTSPSPRDRG